MDFELKNLDILEAEQLTTQDEFKMSQLAPYQNSSSHLENRTDTIRTQSFILNELQKENEELQNKLKLNYRRLLLFEAENHKLAEEKNKLFFESKSSVEKAEILIEKNQELEKENNDYDQQIQLLNEKVYTLTKINSSQLNEIKRFSKFHIKVQNVVKPYILSLKKQISQLKKDFNQSQQEATLFKRLHQDAEEKATCLNEKHEQQIKINQIDRNAIVQSYEEQIHSFSKEILSQQQLSDLQQKEISRLKKAVEFKNYYENELIKFKRIHEEDQFKLQQISDQKNQLETKNLELTSNISRLESDINRFKVELEEKSTTLEITRTQLTKQIDECSHINERLIRLEKLNNQLSREMCSQQNSKS